MVYVQMPDFPKAEQLLEKNEMVVVYYGYPGVKSLGVLGSAKLKVDIYNGIYTHRRAQKIAGGFKLFFDEDNPVIMTPYEVLGLKV